MSRKQQKISRHLKQQLPRLLHQAQATLPAHELWESDAVMVLRATLRPQYGPYIQQEILRLLAGHQAAIPGLMSITPVPSRDYERVLEGWHQNADSRVSTQDPTLDDEEVCPVCLATPPQMTTPCGHRFCNTCLDVCARARPHEPLTCPLCREKLAPARVHPPPGFSNAHSNVSSGGRPRVNESWLSEEELNIYLGYYVPILGS